MISWILHCFARGSYEKNIFSATCSSFDSLVRHKQAQSADDLLTVFRLKGGIEQKLSKSLFHYSAVVHNPLASSA